VKNQKIAGKIADTAGIDLQKESWLAYTSRIAYWLMTAMRSVCHTSRRAGLRALKIAVLMVLLASIGLPAASNSLEGDWAGGFEDGADYVFHQLHFRTRDGKLSGTYDAPLLFQHGRSLRNVSTESSAVTFEISSKPHARIFVGQFTNGVLAGHMKQGAGERPFRFNRLAPIQSERSTGAYQVGPAHFVFLRSGVELGLNAVQFIDFKTGRLGVLFPTTATNFFTGPALLVPEPVEAKVAFTLDAQGQASGFTWTGTQKWTGRRIRLRQEEVSFTNGPITLSGTLILPDAAPPHSVVVCVPASTAAATREMFRHVAEFFALHGVASLIYDKRGLGRSTGDWLRADLSDLADDALAAVRLLKDRSGIRAHRVGLFGASQSGWVVASAASRSQEVAFIISQSGPGVTPEEQELYRNEAWLRADGFSEQEVSDAMKFVVQRYECARTGEGWEALQAAEREARNQRLSIREAQWAKKIRFGISGASFGTTIPCQTLRRSDVRCWPCSGRKTHFYLWRKACVFGKARWRKQATGMSLSASFRRPTIR
jgi:uncharacterized protein